MGYRILGDATVTVHFAFVVFVVIGGFLALRWRRVLYWHIATVAWVTLLIVGMKITCPLTYVENWAREKAGESGIPQGFVDAHLTGVLYPAHLLWLFRTLVGVAIAASWILLGLQARRRHHRDVSQNDATQRQMSAV